MLTAPQIEIRSQSPYAFVHFIVTMNDMQRPANEGFPLLFSTLARQSINPVGPAFYNYRRIDMAGTLDVEAGVAVERAGQDEDDVLFGTLPAGTFANATWHGHPDGLIGATGQLIDWVNEQGLAFDVNAKSDGNHFACRLEIYHSDPVEDPDMNLWQTELAFKLRDRS
ncbi:MAG: GyrI-like domain-containing protein [Phyllobacteriaceae bacterium]|mgnify:FL=1|nr:GyrI-like domain-containing protein [Phyllobacteriaceae bacterium]